MNSATQQLSNKKGLSILETLIAIGIMAILMVGFSSMILNQQKETKSVSEILAGLDLQKNLISVLAEGSVCNYILNNPTQLTFNSSSLPETITPSLPIYASVASGVPGVVVAQVGQTASVYSSSMVIKSIRLDITNGSGSTYTGNWIIDFDETKSVRPHKPVAITAILNVDNSVPAAAKITGCMGSGAGGSNAFVQKCGPNEVMNGYNADGSIACENLDTKYLKLDGTTAMTGDLRLGNNDLLASGTARIGKVQLNDIVVENAACTPNGLVARDTNSILLSCQSGTWEKAQSTMEPFRNKLGLAPKFKNYLKCIETGPTSGSSIYVLNSITAGLITYNNSAYKKNEFNSSGTWNNGGAGGAEDCDGKTLDQLATEGKAYD